MYKYKLENVLKLTKSWSKFYGFFNFNAKVVKLRYKKEIRKLSEEKERLRKLEFLYFGMGDQ